MPENSSAALAGSPVSAGTSNVAAAIASACWSPNPTVRGQLIRSWGPTTARSGSHRPSPFDAAQNGTVVLPARRGTPGGILPRPVVELGAAGPTITHTVQDLQANQVLCSPFEHVRLHHGAITPPLVGSALGLLPSG